MMPPHIRPVTSKARGICKYHTTERGCFSGDRCKFLHARPDSQTNDTEQPLLTPYDQAKRCRYFDNGYCKRGEKCWFLHKSDKNHVVQDDDDEFCSICFEKPAIYGLLGGCSHVFCLPCIKQWRDPQNKPEGVAESGNTKKCPMCRASSKFITPSSKFCRHESEEKAEVIKAYRASMAKVPCRYFLKSLKDGSDPICPYGSDCFYSHMNEDGTPYVFKDGLDVCLKRYAKKARRATSSDILSTLQGYLAYTIRRSDPTSGHPTEDPQLISSGDSSTNRQHDADHGDNEDGLSRAQWLRIQEYDPLAMELLRVGWELRMAGMRGSESDEAEQDPTRRDEQGMEDAQDERENQVMERLEMIADEMLASANVLREIVNEERLHVHPSSEHSGGHGFSGSMTERSDDSDSDMPALQSVSSDDGTDDTDTDTDMPVLQNVSSEGDTDSGERDSQPAIEESTPNQQTEEPTDAHDNSKPSIRTSDAIDARTSNEESVDLRDVRQDTTIVAQQPVTSMNGGGPKASRGSRPSDAFTTDGRGRVISFGDATSAAPSPHPGSGSSGDPESPGESATNQGAERRGGILGWIGSLI